MRIILFLIAFSLMPAIQARAVIVDRVAITVGNKVITESEIDQRIRLTAFQNDEKPDFSLAAQRQAASKLIDQKLIEREMDVGRYPRAAPDVGKNLLADYAKSNYKSNPIAMAAALQTYGLTTQDMEEELALQSEILTFLNLRFRPAVLVTDADVLKYFTEQIKQGEGKTKQVAEAGALNEMRAEIEQKLTTERADKELDAWLQDQRKRTKIEYAEKDLEESAK
jgi:parvulin-like peptidyl-prolyl isomerase